MEKYVNRNDGAMLRTAVFATLDEEHKYGKQWNTCLIVAEASKETARIPVSSVVIDIQLVFTYSLRVSTRIGVSK